ncbi:MAG: hypothetical protein FWE61_09665 [Micrococcales bacterium]|nr:hypothetical protein [Micrococcales bacterium]
MRHRYLRLVFVTGALLLAGCTSKTPDGTWTSATLGPADTAEPVWTVQAQLMNQPSVHDGVVVAYVARPELFTLQVVAWDAKDGTELWRHDAAPGNSVAPGIDMGVDVTESGGTTVVTYLVGDTVTDGTLVAVADLTTGAETRFGPAVWATGRPGDCDDDTGVCLEGRFSGETTSHQIRLDETSATLVTAAASTNQPLPDGARWIGPGLFATYDRGVPAEQLGYAADGAIQWMRPYQDVFGPFSSSDAGWAWQRHDTMFVGVGGVSAWFMNGITLENPTYRTVALAVDTGQTLWSTPGDPCVWPWSTEAEVLAICQSTGTITLHRDPDGKVTDDITVDYTDHTQHVVGIDLKTGTQRWRFPPQGDGPAVPDDGLPSYAAMDDYLVAWDREGPALVEIVTGKATVLAADQTYLCKAHWDDTKVFLRSGGRTSEADDYGRVFLELCGSDGKPVVNAPWPAFFIKAATEVDGLSIIAIGDQLLAFRL